MFDWNCPTVGWKIQVDTKGGNKTYGTDFFIKSFARYDNVCYEQKNVWKFIWKFFLTIIHSHAEEESVFSHVHKNLAS